MAVNVTIEFPCPFCGLSIRAIPDERVRQFYQHNWPVCAEFCELDETDVLLATCRRHVGELLQAGEVP